MPAKIDVVGARFGRLVVVREGQKVPGIRRTVHCICDCGTEREVDPRMLRKGHTQSCGCFHRERVSATTPAAHTTHGRTRTPEYQTWVHMKMRCTNPADPKYPAYGGRGISVCAAWENDFSAFFADMGAKPTPFHTLDRIDVNGPYTKENCRWATPLEQARNKRSHRMVTHNGEAMPLSQACALSGANYRTELWRIQNGRPTSFDVVVSSPLPPAPQDAP